MREDPNSPEVTGEAEGMAPSLQHGSSTRPPRRRTRIYHPLSSYVPFFVFLGTVIIVVLVIILLVGRLLAAIHGAVAPVVVPPTPTTTTVARGPEPPVTPIGQVGSPQGGPLSAGALMFSKSIDVNGKPIGPAQIFPASSARIYAFVTLHNVPQDAEVRFVWTYGAGVPTTLADVPEHQQGPAYPTYTFVSYATPDHATFTTGPYTVTVTVANQLLVTGHLSVVPH